MDGVSVALGTRNGAPFIREQLESILRQTVPVSEIVLSDDDSSDDTLEIARRTVGDRVPLLIERNDEPLGVTGNFEQAIRRTSAEFVVLCDQDDVWRDDRVEAAVTTLRGEPDVDLVFSDARIVDAHGVPTGARLFDLLEIGEDELSGIRDGRAFDVLLRRNLATGATVMFRRSLLESAMPFPQTWVHDEWLAMLASVSSRLRVDPRPLVDYRLHGGNAIGARRPTLRVKVARVLEPGRPRTARLAARAADLVARLVREGAAQELVAAAEAKAAFERRRSALPDRRMARVAPVLSLVRAHDYDRFASQGRLDVVRDLLGAP